MLKASGYFILILFSAIYLTSSSTELTTKFEAIKISSNSIFGSDKYRYGDLFGMSYLPQYQIPSDYQSNVSLMKCNSISTIQLYAICDSYLFSFATDKFVYCGVDSFVYAKTNNREKLYVNLDQQKNNILLLEFSERNLINVLNDTPYVNSLINVSANNQIEPYKQIEPSKETSTSSLYSQLSGFLFNKAINTNLEMNIWDISIFTPIKKFKSYINYKLFNLVDKNVALSPDKKYLLYTPTIDTLSQMSSFQSITDSAVNELIKNLNHIYSTAKRLGFNEVYLAIIPNPVSVLYPDYKGLKYNQLLMRVQNSPDLKMPIVDIYSTFRNTNLPIYLRSDTHWSPDGEYLWLNKFNTILAHHTGN